MSQIATITRKKQLTIPALLFRQAGLKEGQKVLVTEFEGTLKIEPALDLLNRLAGSVPVPEKFEKLSPQEIVRRAKKEYFAKK